AAQCRPSPFVGGTPRPPGNGSRPVHCRSYPHDAPPQAGPHAMKVVCDRAALLEALNLCHGVVPARSTTPVYQCVLLSAKGGGVAISATDAEIALRVAVQQVDIKQEGDALVPADKLLQIVRASEDSTLTLELAKQALHIRGEDAKFKVFGYEPKD